MEGLRRVGEEERGGNKEEIEGRIEKEGEKNCKKGGVGELVGWL